MYLLQKNNTCTLLNLKFSYMNKVGFVLRLKIVTYFSLHLFVFLKKTYQVLKLGYNVLFASI